MPKGLSSVVRDNLEKCRSAAIAAVDVYNRPGPRFRTAHYIVLIIIAWTALSPARSQLECIWKRAQAQEAFEQAAAEARRAEVRNAHQVEPNGVKGGNDDNVY